MIQAISRLISGQRYQRPTVEKGFEDMLDGKAERREGRWPR
jgi:hypothetical protein